MFWPTEEMDFWKINNIEYQVEIKWSKDLFLDYKDLSYQFYDCGFQVFYNVVESGHDNVKSDTWFLTAIFLLRQSMELGLKALLCRVCKRNPDIQKVFENCCHNLTTLWAHYSSIAKVNYLTEEEKQWLENYLISLESIDSKSDIFRFPFEDDFLSQYRNQFIDTFKVASNLLQAFALIKKCLECYTTNPESTFDNTLEPDFFIIAAHGIGNCYLWQSLTDDGFHVKVRGYIEVANFIFKNKALSNEKKLYPLMFMLRHALELCLKRLFYSRVENGVPHHKFFSKRKSHLIKKDLWRNVKPVIEHYSGPQEQNTDLLNIVENKLFVINDIDKNGDIFRYPTSYSLEYRFNSKSLDLKNMYEYMSALINFLNGCDAMLDNIADYELEMLSYYSDSL